jgi:hypothetical protein
MPSRVDTFFGIVIMVLAIVLAAGCSGKSDDPTPAESLQASVDSNWTQYKQTHGVPGGGMAVYI